MPEKTAVSTELLPRTSISLYLAPWTEAKFNVFWAKLELAEYAKTLTARSDDFFVRFYSWIMIQL